MELTNIVYSSTLIFLLILSSIFLVGFLGSQYRKLLLNYSDRKIQTSSRKFTYNTPFVSADVYYPKNNHSAPAESRNKIKFKYYDEEPVRRIKVSKVSKPVKSVSRGSLVREHYNSGSFTYSHKGRNSKGKNNNIIKFN